ncbi:MAG: alcohol dehydrogenase catalytic domain-containing protein [Planctomycetota bacterium]
MRVGMYYNNDDVRVEETPAPKIGPGEALVKVMASGICGSDVMEWYRAQKAPLVLGHEIAGEVVEVGDGVTTCKVGDRISASHHVPCNVCHFCVSGHATVCDTLRTTDFDPGGFAEYLRMPAINVDRGVYHLPDEVSYEEGTFTEPLACVLRGQRLAWLKPGQSVLVVGSGISGTLHIAAARAMGAGRIFATDVSEYRLNGAEKFGADRAIPAGEYSPEMLRELNDGLLADKVFICSGADSAIDQALRSVERGGTVLFFAAARKDSGIALGINEIFWRNEITLTSSYAGNRADHLQALELIRARQIPVKQMITHRLPLDEIGLGFKLVAQADKSIKVIIEPHRS